MAVRISKAAHAMYLHNVWHKADTREHWLPSTLPSAFWTCYLSWTMKKLASTVGLKKRTKWNASMCACKCVRIVYICTCVHKISKYWFYLAQWILSKYQRIFPPGLSNLLNSLLPFPLTQPINSCSPFCPWATGMWITVFLLTVTKPSSLWLVYYRVSSWFQTSKLIWKRHREAAWRNQLPWVHLHGLKKALGSGVSPKRERVPGPQWGPTHQAWAQCRGGLCSQAARVFHKDTQGVSKWRRGNPPRVCREHIWLQLSDTQGTTTPTGTIPEFALLGWSGIYTSSGKPFS